MYKHTYGRFEIHKKNVILLLSPCFEFYHSFHHDFSYDGFSDFMHVFRAYIMKEPQWYVRQCDDKDIVLFF